jgi:GNAT superfamily N-acetyltransferase
MARRPKLEVLPLTPERWPDLVELFERPGGSIVRGCWCMYYRRSGGEGGVGSGATNRKAMRALVDGGTVPGLIGYEDGSPVGWISLGPREDFSKLRRSPVMKPVDDRPVWSIVCFFVDRRARGRGVSEALFRAGIDHARSLGARLLEAYPIDKEEPSHPDFMWFGSKRMYDRGGPGGGSSEGYQAGGPPGSPPGRRGQDSPAVPIGAEPAAGTSSSDMASEPEPSRAPSCFSGPAPSEAWPVEPSLEG